MFTRNNHTIMSLHQVPAGCGPEQGSEAHQSRGGDPEPTERGKVKHGQAFGPVRQPSLPSAEPVPDSEEKEPRSWALGEAMSPDLGPGIKSSRPGAHGERKNPHTSSSQSRHAEATAGDSFIARVCDALHCSQSTKDVFLERVFCFSFTFSFTSTASCFSLYFRFHGGFQGAGGWRI